MAPKERLTAGCICFAYQERPEISTFGTITGSTKDVVSMEWLNADDLSVQVDRDPNGGPEGVTLAPFMVIALHESHFIGLPLIKVPYTQTFNKTCERAERVDRTFLAISPTENTVRLKSKRFDNRFSPLEGTKFPVQKIYKDPKTGRPMPEWDTFVDFAMPIFIKKDRVEWYAEIYKSPVPETIRLIKLYRFVHALDLDIPEQTVDAYGEPIDLEDYERTQKRPVEWVGPGVRTERQNPTPPSSAERKAAGQKKEPHSVNYGNTHTKAAPAGPAHNGSWANVAAGPAAVQQLNKISQAPPKAPLGNQNQQHRGGGWNQNNDNSNWGNRGRGSQRGRGQGGRGNQQSRRGYGGNQMGGQTFGQQKSNVNNNHQTQAGPQKKKELQIPPNGKLIGLNKETTLPAKLIPDLDNEKPAPVDELLALTQEGDAIVKKPTTTTMNQDIQSINEKDKYDFAAFIRNREAKQHIKLDVVPEEKDSAQAISDNDRTTWNKPDCQLNQEPWPEDWEKVKPGSWIVEGINEVPTRDGWDFQAPNMTWWVVVQNWLELKGDERPFRGWEYPDENGNP